MKRLHGFSKRNLPKADNLEASKVGKALSTYASDTAISLAGGIDSGEGAVEGKPLSKSIVRIPEIAES
jgi:hypothetical protein